jgi:predicted lactoylglutathione lyase
MPEPSYYQTNPKRLPLLGHLSLGVKSLEVSRQFYTAVLKPFGVQLQYDRGKQLGFGHDEFAPLDLYQVDNPMPWGEGSHMAFHAPSRQAVDEFFAAALAFGGKSYGDPGLRPEYHENYYGAFVLDPDGYRIEACYQQPLAEAASPTSSAN